MKKIFGLLVLIILIACNKNQSSVRKLDGTWKITSYKVTYAGQDYQFINPFYGIKFVFTKCKLKKDEYCDMSQIVTSTASGSVEETTTNYQYKVLDRGRVLELKENSKTSQIQIVSLSNSNFTFTQVTDTSNVLIEGAKQ
jgi:hypothetical protein